MRTMSQNYFYLVSKLTSSVAILVVERNTVSTACTPLSPTEWGLLEASRTKQFHIISGPCVVFMNIFCLKISLKSNYLVPVSKLLDEHCSLSSPFPWWISVCMSTRRLNVPLADLWTPPDGGGSQQHTWGQGCRPEGPNQAGRTGRQELHKIQPGQMQHPALGRDWHPCTKAGWGLTGCGAALLKMTRLTWCAADKHKQQQSQQDYVNRGTASTSREMSSPAQSALIRFHPYGCFPLWLP